MGAKYYYDSYAESGATTYYGSGTVVTTGQKQGEYSEVQVTADNNHPQFIGKKYWVESDAKTDGSEVYQLYTNQGETGTGLYVKVYTEQPKRTINFTVKDSSDDSAVNGATITIGDITKTTGSSGGCTASLTDGEYEVEVSKTDYTTKTETITVTYEDTLFTISITPSG